MKNVKIKQLKPDDKNVNKHSEEGMELLDKSISEVGWTEAIIISDDDFIISGNARTEKALEKGIEDADIIESDGVKPIIIRRKDIKSGTAKFHKAAILSNTVSKHNMVEDAEVSEALCEEFNLDGESLGLESEEELHSPGIKRVGMEPYNMTHILFSFPPEKLVLIQPLLEQISKVEGVEIEQSSN